jgi:hypothetical protein
MTTTLPSTRRRETAAMWHRRVAACVFFWPISDAQGPRLNVHYAHIANVRRADSTVGCA